ncbi:MAG: hypothetical protein AMS22_00910 [Thiotrichales bacterium SG8_50]|jgi:glycosyltransferase involved in cell wall biosynthesis|nr:MAG: hypothetical protein AMS22_00910 [Thiotrichales bacterium SG8_50]
MHKRVVLFSTGIPDPTQGGSGIFNYYVARELLRRGDSVQAFFRVNERFLQDHTVGQHLEELSGYGLEYSFVHERPYERTLDFGYKLLRRAHQAAVCEQVVRSLGEEVNKYDAIVALDLGWALALADVRVPALAMLGDPLPARLQYGRRYSWWSPTSVKAWMQMKSLFTVSTQEQLARALAGQLSIGSFSPHHANEYRAQGIACQHFPWFSAEVDNRPRTTANVPADRLRLLHVGTLESTASRNMLSYWKGELLPRLGRLNFMIDITFVGRGAEQIRSEWPNINIRNNGYEESLDNEFANADVFLSPMKYRVGTRTRILTALSYGIPVIADNSSADGLPELTNRNNIFYASDPEQVAELLEELRMHPQLVRTASANARATWERHYNPVQNVNALLRSVGI